MASTRVQDSLETLAKFCAHDIYLERGSIFTSISTVFMTKRRVKSTLRGQIYGPLPDRASGCSLLVIMWGWGSGVEKWLWLSPNSKAPRQRKNGVQHPCSQGPWAPKPSFKTVQECVALCLEGTENDKFPMAVTGASFLNHGHVTGRRHWPLCHYYYWFSYQVSWLKTKNIKELPYCKR